MARSIRFAVHGSPRSCSMPGASMEIPKTCVKSSRSCAARASSSSIHSSSARMENCASFRRIRRKTPTSIPPAASRCASPLAPPITWPSCAPSSMPPPALPGSLARMPESLPAFPPQCQNCHRWKSGRTAASWNGPALTARPSPATATSPTSSACIPSTKSHRIHRSSSQRHARHLNTASLTVAPKPAGAVPGRSTSSPACAMATPPPCTARNCCAAARCRTSSTPTRHSRSMAISASLPAFVKCSCKATAAPMTAAL